MSKIGYMFIGAMFTVIISVGFLTFAQTDRVEIETGDPVVLNDTLTEFNDRIQVDEKIIVGDPKVNEKVTDQLGVNALEERTKEESKEQAPIELVTATVEPQASNHFLQKVNKLEIEIENDEVELEIKQERKKKRLKTKVGIETKKEKVKLEGTKAEQFVEEMFANVNVQSAHDIRLAVDQLLLQFQIDRDTVEIEMEVKTDGKKYEFKN